MNDNSLLGLYTYSSGLPSDVLKMVNGVSQTGSYVEAGVGYYHHTVYGSKDFMIPKLGGFDQLPGSTFETLSVSLSNTVIETNTESSYHTSVSLSANGGVISISDSITYTIDGFTSYNQQIILHMDDMSFGTSVSMTYDGQVFGMHGDFYQYVLKPSEVKVEDLLMGGGGGPLPEDEWTLTLQGYMDLQPGSDIIDIGLLGDGDNLPMSQLPIGTFLLGADMRDGLWDDRLTSLGAADAVISNLGVGFEQPVGDYYMATLGLSMFGGSSKYMDGYLMVAGSTMVGSPTGLPATIKLDLGFPRSSIVTNLYKYTK